MTGVDPFRLLFTGGRAVTDRAAIVCALSDEVAKLQPWTQPVVLVHGGSVDKAGDPVGADWLADDIWRGWAAAYPERYLKPEVHPAKGHATPLDRNLAMVELGADACLSVASSYASGTGHCARAARRANIETTDYGFPTARKIAGRTVPTLEPDTDQLTLGPTPAAKKGTRR